LSALDSRTRQDIERHANPRIPRFVILYWVIAPIAAVLVFHISLINQAGYIDPEFYTGYGYSFQRMWLEYGCTYYAARFPVIFLNSLFQNIGHGLSGYILLRLLILWCSGIPLFLMVRRLYGTAIACAAYAFLFLNPLLPRILFWDLTTFLSVPTALAGIAVWHLRDKRSLGASVVSGFLFGVSVNSQAFTGTAIGLFLLVEFGFCFADVAPWRQLLSDILGLAIGGLICMGLGLLFYWGNVGYVSPRTLWNVTLNAIHSGQQYSESHHLPFSQFFATDYDIYVPYITSAVAALVLRSSLFRNTIEARIAWFSMLYCAAYAFAVFVLRMDLANTYYYVAHLTIVTYLTVPVVLGRVTNLADQTRAGLAGLFVLGLLIPLVIVRLDPRYALHLSNIANGAPQVVVLIGAAVALAAVLSVVRRPNIAALSALFLFGGLTQIPLLFNPYLQVYLNGPERPDEVALYKMIRQYHVLLNKYDKPSERVRTWYSTDSSYLFSSLTSSNLLFTLQNPWTHDANSVMPTLGAYERERLADPQTKYVLLLDPNPEMIQRGLEALRSAGLDIESTEAEEWGKEPFTAYALLVRILRVSPKHGAPLANIPLANLKSAAELAPSPVLSTFIRIETAPRQGAQSFEADLSEKLKDVQGSIAVCAKVQTLAGKIGIELTQAASPTQVLSEVEIGPDSEIREYCMRADASQIGHVIVRNLSDAGPSKALIESVTLDAPE